MRCTDVSSSCSSAGYRRATLVTCPSSRPHAARGVDAAAAAVLVALVLLPRSPASLPDDDLQETNGGTAGSALAAANHPPQRWWWRGGARAAGCNIVADNVLGAAMRPGSGVGLGCTLPLPLVGSPRAGCTHPHPGVEHQPCCHMVQLRWTCSANSLCPVPLGGVHGWPPHRSPRQQQSRSSLNPSVTRSPVLHTSFPTHRNPTAVKSRPQHTRRQQLRVGLTAATSDTAPPPPPGPPRPQEGGPHPMACLSHRLDRGRCSTRP